MVIQYHDTRQALLPSTTINHVHIACESHALLHSSNAIVILIGIVLMSIGMFFVGTSKTLHLENSPVMIMLGLMIIGAAAGTISIPVLPEMLESIEERSDRNYNMEELNNYISGIFVTCTGLGEFIGPVLSSILNEKYGFRMA